MVDYPSATPCPGDLFHNALEPKMSFKSVSQHLSQSSVPQSEALPGQVSNSAGGHSFQVDVWTRLRRFLVLGSDGGSYYSSERKLTTDNAKSVVEAVKLDGPRVVRELVEVSQDGRAPKNDPALLALALCIKNGDEQTRRAAYAALPVVARIGTHLFHFAEFAKSLEIGWGRGMKRAVAGWYLDKTPVELGYQIIKYQQRDGWSHRDLLRKSHPVFSDAAANAVAYYAVKGWESVGEVPHPDYSLGQVWAFERAKQLTSQADVPKLVELVLEYGLPHECVPNEVKQYSEVWEALLPCMGVSAVVRNLGKMTSVGLLRPLSDATSNVLKILSNPVALKKSRIHPLQVLVALKTYAQGHGDKGSLTWTPVQSIVDALDSAFYLTFKNVEPTGKKTMLALDVSGSMGDAIAGLPISCREASAALALVTANVESDYYICGFTTSTPYDRSNTELTPLKISPKMRLDAVVQEVYKHDFGATDCALPILHADRAGLDVENFVVYTDSETWAGSIHPHVALRNYRKARGIDAKLAVVGMVANNFSIADPNDSGMMDFVGFDTATPAVLSDFFRG